MNFNLKSINYKTGYFISLLLLTASLPLSKYTMSIFQFLLLFFWLWHGIDIVEIKEKSNSKFKIFYKTIAEIFVQLGKKFKALFQNKPALVIVLIYVMHVVGLFYSEDTNFALRDLRIKLPLFILPLFIATGPKISLKQLYIIFIAYIIAVVMGVFYQLSLFTKVNEANAYAINAHVSHIRFSLNAIFAVCLCFYFLLSNNFKKYKYRWLALIPIAIIFVFINYFSYKTGIILFPLVILASLAYLLFKIKNKKKKKLIFIFSLGIFLIFIFVFSLLIKSTKVTPVNFENLDSKSFYGNNYTHDTINFKTSNGKWIGLYICKPELKKAWEAKSSIPFDGKDANNQQIYTTLVKYLSSKNLRKDAKGVEMLTEVDINNIENGINTVNFRDRKTLRNHIEDFNFAYSNYKKNRNANYNSLLQRVEYWRTSVEIIKKYPLFGVGTGDVQLAFDKQYDEMNSTLKKEYRHRSHNQFLAITIAFGIFGLIFFVFAQFYPFIKNKGFSTYYYWIFWFIVMVSMLVEDTLETQEGVTFYALFTSLLLFSIQKVIKKE